MRATTAAMAVVGVFGALAASTPARADWDDHDGGWRRHERERERRERAWQAYAPPQRPLLEAPASRSGLASAELRVSPPGMDPRWRARSRGRVKA